MDKFYTIGLLTNKVSVALSKALNAILIENNIDLPHSQFVVLRTLYYRDGISQLDIANLISKDAAAIKRTLDNLEDKGLIERKQVRILKNSVYITDKGRELMPKILKIVNVMIEKALHEIEPENRALLKSMLNKICTNLEKE